MMRQYWVHDIEWEHDGESSKLPIDVIIGVQDTEGFALTPKQLRQHLSKVLWKKYGAHRDFAFMEFEPYKTVKVSW
jgi:hypothetical protein